MMVTDKEFSMDKKLVEKITLMCHRCTGKHKFDNAIIVDGDEGTGKSTISGEIGYFVHHITGRPFSVDNIFFDINKLLKFAAETEDQIIIWDEAALAGLAAEWRNKAQRILIKMLMIARKKRHFYIFCIPKFFKLNEYLVIDRSIALIHVYARKEIQLGRFVYFKKRAKEKLFYDWKKSKKRNYKKLSNFRGSFPNALDKLIDIEEYERKKDEAIRNMLKEEQTKANSKLLVLQYLVATMVKDLSEEYGTPIKNFSDKLNIVRATIYDWLKIPKKYPDLLESEGL